MKRALSIILTLIFPLFNALFSWSVFAFVTMFTLLLFIKSGEPNYNIISWLAMNSIIAVAGLGLIFQITGFVFILNEKSLSKAYRYIYMPAIGSISLFILTLLVLFVAEFFTVI